MACHQTGDNPLPELIRVKFYALIWRHQATMNLLIVACGCGMLVKILFILGLGNVPLKFRIV